MTTCACTRHLAHEMCLTFCECRTPDEPVGGRPEDNGAAPQVRQGAPDVRTLDGLRYSLTNQAPIDPAVIEIFEAVRSHAYVYAEVMLRLCPDGRAKSIATTKLEESVMWAIKAIAIDQAGALDLWGVQP